MYLFTIEVIILNKNYIFEGILFLESLYANVVAYQCTINMSKFML